MNRHTASGPGDPVEPTEPVDPTDPTDPVDPSPADGGGIEVKEDR